jgi:polyisoprenoid-binding protein YceI
MLLLQKQKGGLMIRILFFIFCILITFSKSFFPQGFDIDTSGIYTFSFKDSQGRNQTTFSSITELDEVNGTSNDINGKISFDVNKLASTLEGEIFISTASLKTGIEKRDKDLMNSKWLHAEKYPVISFTIKKVNSIKKLSDNKLFINVTGDFLLHGVKKEIPVDVTLTYLKESSITQKRGPGDLLGVVSKFQIQLSDYGVENLILGTRVANKIDIGVNIIGTTKY